MNGPTGGRRRRARGTGETGSGPASARRPFDPDRRAAVSAPRTLPPCPHALARKRYRAHRAPPVAPPPEDPTGARRPSSSSHMPAPSCRPLFGDVPPFFLIEIKGMTIGCVGHVPRRGQRREVHGRETAQTDALLERKRATLINIIPADDQGSVLAEAIEGCLEPILDVFARIQAPTEDAIAQNQIERAGVKVAREILHPVDDVLPCAIFYLSRIDIDRPIVLPF